MTPSRPPTVKGERAAARVLQAATTVLARDGYGGATLGRIAEEAGIPKRNVLYYYGTREALLVRVVQTVGGRIAEHVAAATTPDQDPRGVAEATVEGLWSGVTSVPEPSRAYFALVGGGAGAPEVEEALQQLKGAFLQAVTEQLRTVDPTRWRLRDDDEERASTWAVVLLRGLLLEWVESGSTDAVAGGVARFKDALEREFVPVG
ncbi:MAG: rutR [Solirubrobacterales bacterium]|nr:rutR [Solirubrobacterales bacterium]